jgi:hypothetical protein
MNICTSDLEAFRLAPGASRRVPHTKRLPRHKAGKWFLKGPIPGDWLGQAGKLPGRALHVALALWYLAGVGKTPTVKLTGGVLSRFGSPPDAGRRGLAALEGAGLVSVDRHSGRCPVVTIQGVVTEQG